MTVSTMREISGLVRDARRRQGLTQADLARRVGVSRDWVVRLEQANPRLEVQRVLDTLVVLGLEIDVLSPRSDPPRDGAAAGPPGEADDAHADPDPFDFLVDRGR